MTKTLSLVVTGLLLVFSGCNKSDLAVSSEKRVATGLAKVDPRDKRKIESLFATLLGQSGAAYTLFGPKPCTLENYAMDAHALFPVSFGNPYFELSLSDGWEAWERHAHLFPSESYALRKVPGKPGTYGNIVVINKPAMEQVLGKNKDLFRDALGINGNAHEMQQQILNTPSLLYACFDDSVLIGVLLGYGSANAKAFARRTELCLYINSLQRPPYASPAQMSTLSEQSMFHVRYGNGRIGSADKKRVEQESLKSGVSVFDELNDICSSLNGIQETELHVCLEAVRRPSFAAIMNDPETQQWLAAYDKVHKQLPPFEGPEKNLELVLTRWVSNEPDTL